MSVTHCTHGITAVSGRSVDLDPAEAREFTFQIRMYRAIGSDYLCEVQLFDADYNLIQSAHVSFATNGTHFCYGICGCVCNPLEELVCPELPTFVISGNMAKKIVFIILNTLGAHGVALIDIWWNAVDPWLLQTELWEASASAMTTTTATPDSNVTSAHTRTDYYHVIIV